MKESRKSSEEGVLDTWDSGTRGRDSMLWLFAVLVVVGAVGSIVLGAELEAVALQHALLVGGGCWWRAW